MKTEMKHDEFFDYIGCAFNVTKAKVIAERLKETDVDVEPYKRAIFPEKKEGNKTTMSLIRVDEKHAKEVNTSTPIIIASLSFDDGEGTTHIIIDGNHRVFKRLWIEKEVSMKAYILTPEETLQIMVGPLRAHQEKYLKKKGKI